MKSGQLALAFLLASVGLAAARALDIARFENDTHTDVIVFLEDRPQHYYASFGVAHGSFNNIDVRRNTTVIVTLVPRGEEDSVAIVPLGRQIAKSKLFVPPRKGGDKKTRYLVYRIKNGKIRFLREGPKTNVTVTGNPQGQVTLGTGCVGTGGVCLVVSKRASRP